jgi:hypothetical protein
MKTLLAAAAALALMSGAGFAQSTYSSSSSETTKVAPPTHDVDVTSTTRRTDGRNGTLIEKDESGNEVTRPGGVATSRTQSETTTVR